MYCLQEMYTSIRTYIIITVILLKVTSILFNWKVMSFPTDLQGRGAVKDGSHSNDTCTCNVHYLMHVKMCDAC